MMCIYADVVWHAITTMSPIIIVCHSHYQTCLFNWINRFENTFCDSQGAHEWGGKLEFNILWDIQTELHILIAFQQNDSPYQFHSLYLVIFLKLKIRHWRKVNRTQNSHTNWIQNSSFVTMQAAVINSVKTKKTNVNWQHFLFLWYKR